MVPGKPEDFTSPHAGFEGQEEGLGNLFGGAFIAERLEDGRCLFTMYSPAPRGWVKWFSYILEQVVPDQPPSDSL